MLSLVEFYLTCDPIPGEDDILPSFDLARGLHFGLVALLSEPEAAAGHASTAELG